MLMRARWLRQGSAALLLCFAQIGCGHASVTLEIEGPFSGRLLGPSPAKAHIMLFIDKIAVGQFAIEPKVSVSGFNVLNLASGERYGEMNVHVDEMFVLGDDRSMRAQYSASVLRDFGKSFGDGESYPDPIRVQGSAPIIAELKVQDTAVFFWQSIDPARNIRPFHGLAFIDRVQFWARSANNWQFQSDNCTRASFGASCGDPSRARQTDSEKPENCSENCNDDGADRRPNFGMPTRNERYALNDDAALVGASILMGVVIWLLLAAGLYDLFYEARSHQK